MGECVVFAFSVINKCAGKFVLDDQRCINHTRQSLLSLIPYDFIFLVLFDGKQSGKRDLTIG